MNKPTYIELDKAIALMNLTFARPERLIRFLELVPAADVAPVIHAHWIEEDDGWGNSYWTCSYCREPWWLEEGTPEDNNMFFCTNCGAKMDEVVE